MCSATTACTRSRPRAAIDPRLAGFDDRTSSLVRDLGAAAGSGKANRKKTASKQSPEGGHSKPPAESAQPVGYKSLLKSLGPGLITGASDDDPSGIGTYSQ